MSSMREDSKKDWLSASTPDHFKVGCLQRIANAVEVMSVRYTDLIDERDRYKRWYEEERARNKKLRYRITGLRGAITRLKGKLK